MIDRDRRCELLAAAEPDALAELAERCLADGPEPTVLSGPEVGVVALQVREPVVGERFYLGEVLVTQVEIALDGTRSWAMRSGSDKAATLAAAVLDAEVEAGRSLAPDVLELCRTTEMALAGDDAAEWSEIAPTEVQFEELDL
jgi:alpha-D-ribose 1-methylphosphonate 5-triphosphate synthase subunit PhnG